jgi:hypothetical protein
MPSQEITNGELMEQLLEIKGDVGETKGKLDSFMYTHTDVDKRLKAVEQKQWWMTGAGTALGSVLGWLGTSHIKF